MVQSGRCARHRAPLLSRPSPPDEAREEDDVRRRGRNLARVHGHPPSRGRPCAAARLPTAAPPALAAAVRPVVEALSALLPAQPGKPALRPASPSLVRAEPSGRGLCRDLCGVAAAALELADAICRLAGAEEARICRRADGRDCGKATADHDAGACRSIGRLSQTLEDHYKKKQAFYAFTPPKTYDRDLSRLFSADPRHHRSKPASA